MFFSCVKKRKRVQFDWKVVSLGSWKHIITIYIRQIDDYHRINDYNYRNWNPSDFWTSIGDTLRESLHSLEKRRLFGILNKKSNNLYFFSVNKQWFSKQQIRENSSESSVNILRVYIYSHRLENADKQVLYKPYQISVLIICVYHRFPIFHQVFLA